MTLEQAARALVEKLEECAVSVKAMAEFWQAHCGQYTGPSYADELAAVKAILGI